MNAFNHQDPFTHMADLLRDWLHAARASEIRRMLELVAQELQRRGFTLNWTVTPPPPTDPTQ